MQKYETVSKLSSIQFRRLTGVQKTTFREMVSVIAKVENKRSSRRGKPSHLSIEDKVLMSLEYLREYRTYFHLGQSYGLSESACYRNCKWVENILITSKAFSLPGKKALLKSDAEFEVILIDATESPIERPKKKNALQKANKKQKQQAKALLFWEKEKTYFKESGSRR
jgi:DDE superfamily endonuclease